VIRTRARAFLPLTALMGMAACLPDGGRPDVEGASLAHVLEAEDARPAEGPELDALIAGGSDDDTRVRRIAVRALGRLRNPELVDEIAPHLSDDDASVRAAAAEALALAVHGGDGAIAFTHLLARVPVEREGVARAALARAIGRLTLVPPDRRRAAEALTALAGSDGATAPEAVLVGVALGFESLLRGASDDGLDRAAADVLEAMATYAGTRPDDLVAARVRALAVSTLGMSRRLGLASIERAQADVDPDVRRAPLRYLNAVPSSERPAILRRALADAAPRVVIEALRIVAGGPRTSEACGWLFAAASPHEPATARLVALDALSRQCPDVRGQSELLRAAAAGLPPAESDPWQPAAHALVSLARIDAARASELLPRFARHASPFVRAYAASVAGSVGAEATLDALAGDPDPNVRGPALEALFAEHGHAIDDLLLDQLAQDDPQLLMTVSGLLAGSPGGAAVAAALLVKLERLSAARRETWRDPRRALLERVGQLGDASFASRLRPYLTDYDALVAADAAAIVGEWTGTAAVAEPSPLPRAPLPPADELALLRRTSVALHMRGGGTIVIDLLADVAPRNAWRFVTLARAGYFDGLTFHRWSPNFVIQGGSPGANEYAGDGPYTRDEVGEPHWRGTVGVSTRGRDTGDGQIFINLVDNTWLDPDYTVLGFVSAGMDVVDAVLEGAIIDRAEVRAGR